MAGKQNKPEAPGGASGQEGNALDSIDLTPSDETAGSEAPPDGEIEAGQDRALDPENPDETYTVDVTRRELALLNLIRSIKSGNIESLDVSNGVPISIKKVINGINFGDQATTDALAKPTDPEKRIFLR